MPREKEMYRYNIERIDKAFPNKELLNKTDVVKYTGLSYAKVRSTFSFNGNYISKTVFASELS